MIVESLETITLVGGAELDSETLKRALNLAPRLVAADGGANAALAHKIMPEAVIGDGDSITQASRKALPRGILHQIQEQDSTDFDKALRNIHAPLVIGVGFSGARLDHELAAFNVLVRFPERPCILLGAQQIVFLCPPSLQVDLPVGTSASLFPMGAVEGVSDGLQWPIAGLNFAPDGQIGTSNITTGPLHLSVTSPKMLVILPASTFEAVVAAFLGNAARWP